MSIAFFTLTEVRMYRCAVVKGMCGVFFRFVGVDLFVHAHLYSAVRAHFRFKMSAWHIKTQKHTRQARLETESTSFML